MPEQLEKDELGRLGKIQNKTKHQPQNKTTSQQAAKSHRSGNTSVEKPGCQATPRLFLSFQPQHLTLHREWRLDWQGCY